MSNNADDNEYLSDLLGSATRVARARLLEIDADALEYWHARAKDLEDSRRGWEERCDELEYRLMNAKADRDNYWRKICAVLERLKTFPTSASPFVHQIRDALDDKEK